MPRSGRSVRVLVADASAGERALIDVLLSEADLVVTFAASGHEALSFLQDHAPDVALLAMNLPDVPGDEICRRARRLPRLERMGVILVDDALGPHGLSSEQHARAGEVGADLVLPRPLGDKNLRSRIDRVLSSREALTLPPPIGARGDAALEQTTDTEGTSLPSLPVKTHVQSGTADAGAPQSEAERLRRRIAELETQLADLMNRNDTLSDRLEACEERARVPHDRGDRGRNGRSGD